MNEGPAVVSGRKTRSPLACPVERGPAAPRGLACSLSTSRSQGGMDVSCPRWSPCSGGAPWTGAEEPGGRFQGRPKRAGVRLDRPLAANRVSHGESLRSLKNASLFVRQPGSIRRLDACQTASEGYPVRMHGPGHGRHFARGGELIRSGVPASPRAASSSPGHRAWGSCGSLTSGLST